MNDYKDRFSDLVYYENPVPSREITIRGHRITDIKTEDVIVFCEARKIPPEWLVYALIKEID